MPDEPAILEALQKFADAVTGKTTTLTAGEPEDQLRAPLEAFMADAGEARHVPVVCTGEAKAGRIGKPDYAVHSAGLLVGFVELKAPGVGADPKRFTGRNREQWKRFQAIPNLLYCDGNEWSLYREGKSERPIVRLSGDVAAGGRKAVTAEDAQALWELLADFFSWSPIIPRNVKDLAGLLAPLCRMLRNDVTDALKDPGSPLHDLAKDWRKLLFPDADDERFADAYAQTVTFALLLARSEGADPLDLSSAEKALAAEHSLLSRALQVLTDRDARAEISASLELLLRVVREVPQDAVKRNGDADPWLFFYEDFLTAYDPQLRRDAGAYYTPVEVVKAQVSLIDDLLTNRLGKPFGFADAGVVTLDPAAGTGTYLLGVIEHALTKVETDQGAGAVPGRATALAGNLYGFEIMVGPYAVAELRVSRAVANRGAKLPADGTHVYLTDTLESSYAIPPELPRYLKPISDQHRRALEVKGQVPVIVCLGNPPYDRHEAADETNKARTGGWVRWGDDGEGNILEPGDGEKLHITAPAILRAFIDPAIAAGHGVHIKNLYNLYVYFWRWALWKVFESKTAGGPGVVSFISAASYFDGDAFCGMREHLRRTCDDIWVLDLGGEGRGTRKSDNVFAIQTPVAIAVAVRYRKGDTDTPANVHYARIDGTRKEKLEALDAIRAFRSVRWEDCPGDWHAPFRPASNGKYSDWPLLTDLMPWQHSGVQLKRTWPIAPDRDTLARRWRALLKADDRAAAFRSTDDREIDGTYRVALTAGADITPIAEVPRGTPIPPVVRYAYRSLDRHYIIADGRLMSRPRPDLWAILGRRQVYLTSLLTKPLGTGPAAIACDVVPDLDHFSGRGAKDILPLYRNAEGDDPNILPGLLELLKKRYRRKVTPEDLLAYVYGILAQPSFTGRFADELGSRELRVPLTKNAALFEKVRKAGAKLLWLHTYGERFVPKGKHKGQVPRGKARCIQAVPGDEDGYPDKYQYNRAAKTLRVGDGEFAPVEPDVYDFDVSGLKVLHSWLKYRMKRGGGKKSSPLDDIRPERWTGEFTTELLELLWVLAATVAAYPAQAKLLSAVIRGACFKAGDLPPVPDAARKPPPRPCENGLFHPNNHQRQEGG